MSYAVYLHPNLRQKCGPGGAWEKTLQLAEKIARSSAPPSAHVPGFDWLGPPWLARPLGSGRSLIARRAVAKSSNGEVHVSVYIVDVVNATPSELSESVPAKWELAYREVCEAGVRVPFDAEPTEEDRAPAKVPAILFGWVKAIAPRVISWYIFETDRWVSAMAGLDSLRRATARDLLAIIANRARGKTEPISALHTRTYGDLAAHYCYIFDNVLCLDLEHRRPQSEPSAVASELYDRLASRIRELRGTQNRGKVLDIAARVTARAYNALLLADDDAWLMVVDPHPRLRGVAPSLRHQHALALSSEELAVLEQLAQRRGLPAFIEGRAGSGKSTTLFYYITDLVRFAPRSLLPEESTLTFVTHSPELVRVAEEVVHRLVDLADVEETTLGLTQDRLRFVTFRDFCRELLPGKVRQQFDEDAGGGTYMSAARFRLLYENPRNHHSFTGNRCVPWEVAWHVIRTYIKGYRVPASSSDPEWLSPAEYEAVVPGKRRSVNREQYAGVWRHVWPWYRDLVGPGKAYWDDIDLARAVIESGQAEGRGRVGVLICDEAQDFTRVEFLALLSALVWRSYDLQPLVEAGRADLPIVLAGDPCQTVNPTGFQWAGLADMLQTALSDSLGYDGVIRVTPAELEYNYRNPFAVARAANAVQLVRRKYFPSNFGSVKCQRAWQEAPGGLFLVVHESGEELGWLLEKGVVVIVPWAREELLEEREDLAPAAARYAERLLSPGDAKGLEFGHVVLFHFGEHFAKRGLDRLWRTEPEEVDEDLQIMAQHFFNGLYVAITRARVAVYIVDTRRGIEKLWEPMKELIARAADDAWREQTALDLVKATLEEITADDPLDVARVWAARAQANEDPFAARAAANWFQVAKQPHMAKYWKAHALYWEGETERAADVLTALGQCGSASGSEIATACRWYWETGAWSKVVAHAPDRGGEGWRVRMEVARRMSKESVTQKQIMEIVQLLLEYREQLRAPSWLRERRGWQLALSQLAESLSQLAAALDRMFLDQCARLFDLAAATGYVLPAKALATIYYEAGVRHPDRGREQSLLRQAVAYFEAAAETHAQHYYHALGRTSPYPDSLLPLAAARKWEEVKAAFERSVQRQGEQEAICSLNVQQQRAVAEAYLELGDPERALTFGLVAGQQVPVRVLHRFGNTRWFQRGIRTYLEQAAQLADAREQAFLAELLDALLGVGTRDAERPEAVTKVLGLSESARRRFIWDVLERGVRANIWEWACTKAKDTHTELLDLERARLRPGEQHLPTSHPEEFERRVQERFRQLVAYERLQVWMDGLDAYVRHLTTSAERGVIKGAARGSGARREWARTRESVLLTIQGALALVYREDSKAASGEQGSDSSRRQGGQKAEHTDVGQENSRGQGRRVSGDSRTRIVPHKWNSDEQKVLLAQHEHQGRLAAKAIQLTAAVPEEYFSKRHLQGDAKEIDRKLGRLMVGVCEFLEGEFHEAVRLRAASENARPPAAPGPIPDGEASQRQKAEKPAVQWELVAPRWRAAVEFAIRAYRLSEDSAGFVRFLDSAKRALEVWGRTEDLEWLRDRRVVAHHRGFRLSESSPSRSIAGVLIKWLPERREVLIRSERTERSSFFSLAHLQFIGAGQLPTTTVVQGRRWRVVVDDQTVELTALGGLHELRIRVGGVDVIVPLPRE